MQALTKRHGLLRDFSHKNADLQELKQEEMRHKWKNKPKAQEWKEQVLIINLGSVKVTSLVLGK